MKLSHDHLAWTSADRALQTAYASGDILTLATALRTWAIVLRRAGRAETAHRLIVDTAATLQPELDRGPEYLSVFGSLLATAAYTAAVDGDRHTARALIDEAADAARRLGADGNHRFTAFGPTGVRLYQISIARVLGDSGAAIEAARQIDPTQFRLSNAAPATGPTSHGRSRSGASPSSATARCWPPNAPHRTRSASANPCTRSPPACCATPHAPCPACGPSPAASARADAWPGHPPYDARSARSDVPAHGLRAQLPWMARSAAGSQRPSRSAALRAAISTGSHTGANGGA